METKNYPFIIRFQVIPKNPTKDQKDFANNLWEDDTLKEIMNEIVSKHKDRFVFLERCEAVIASADLKKQLRAGPTYNKYLTFHQQHSQCIECFTLEELALICHEFKPLLEKFLGYSIYSPEILINPDEILE